MVHWLFTYLFTEMLWRTSKVVYNLCVFMESFGDVKTLPLRPGVGGERGREREGGSRETWSFSLFSCDVTRYWLVIWNVVSLCAHEFMCDVMLCLHKEARGLFIFHLTGWFHLEGSEWLFLHTWGSLVLSRGRVCLVVFQKAVYCVWFVFVIWSSVHTTYFYCWLRIFIVEVVLLLK